MVPDWDPPVARGTLLEKKITGKSQGTNVETFCQNSDPPPNDARGRPPRGRTPIRGIPLWAAPKSPTYGGRIEPTQGPPSRGG